MPVVIMLIMRLCMHGRFDVRTSRGRRGFAGSIPRRSEIERLDDGRRSENPKPVAYVFVEEWRKPQKSIIYIAEN